MLRPPRLIFRPMARIPSTPGFSADLPLIRCIGLNKRFGAGRVLFEQAELRVERGEFVCLSGPSGSGKTTLINLLMALEPIGSGRIVVAGTHLENLSGACLRPYRRKLGLLSSAFPLLPNRTVRANVALPLAVTGHGPALVEEKVTAALRLVGLEWCARALCRELTAGDRQLTALARAAAPGPVLLLADEPTSHLSRADARRVRQQLGRVRQLGTTILVTTHDPRPYDEVDQVRHIRIVERRFRDEPPHIAPTPNRATTGALGEP